MRRSRGVLLFFSILVLHLVVLTFIKASSVKHYIIDKVPLPTKLRNYILSAPRSTAHREARDFDLALNKIIQEKLNPSDPENVRLRKQAEQVQKVLDETRFEADTDAFTITIPPAEELPEIHQYDPRFTFGLILQYINRNHDWENSEEGELEIPSFHWSDYTDMTVLDEYFLKTKKTSCKKFDVTRRNPQVNRQHDLFQTSTYCLQDDQLDAILAKPDNHDASFVSRVQELKDNQAEGRGLTTGFHIFSFSGRHKKSLRPVIAKSYLNDFMRSPLSMTFLLPGDKSFQVNVNQEERTKLQDSPIFQAGDVNVRNEIEQLCNKLESDFTVLDFEKKLNASQFVDPTEAIINELEPQENLNQTDINYYNSLLVSEDVDDPPKYFREANLIKNEPNFGAGGHYDWRFMNGIVNGTPKLGISIHGLVRAFLKLTNQHNLSAWVAHGSLLAWYWNGLQFPWDGDVDVQMPIEDLHRLSRLFNQTMVVDFGSSLDKEIRYGRYFLDSSTFISQRSKGNGRNNIDARFVDLDTGLYVDITGLALSESTAPARYNALLKGTRLDRDSKDESIAEIDRNTMLEVYNCRNNHFSRLQELSPLKLSIVEGDYGYIPFAFENMLATEYGEKSMSQMSYRGHVYLQRLRLWVLRGSIVHFVLKGNKEAIANAEEKKLPVAVDMSDQEYTRFLLQRPGTFKDYLLTHDATEFHQEELYRLFQNKPQRPLFFNEDGSMDHSRRRALKRGFFDFVTKEQNYEYDVELEWYESELEKYDKQVASIKEAMAMKENSSQEIESTENLAENAAENSKPKDDGSRSQKDKPDAGPPKKADANSPKNQKPNIVAKSIPSEVPPPRT
ncbi:uncharacterized protein LODBEIA_P02000 [Lodderomyces beijingensis]|uniref:LicD/FKTN/FKRP nucleotidyltransferase domain-containing protein n=1 Tax=Lodderomyces beijingensis TaxID=1775926 RepID=A0ABP0ZFM9_9ASCO